MSFLRIAFMSLCACALLTYAARPLTVHAFLQEGGPESGRKMEGPDEHKAGHEEAEEDEAAKFKQSSSVRFIAKITGLSLNGAYWLCVILNFAVIAGLIFWMSKKNLPSVFRNRTATIQKAMQEARQASEDANRRLSDIESRLKRLDSEIAGIRSTAEAEGLKEEERIKAATEEEIRKVVEGAEQEIAAAAKSARRELGAFAADLVVSLAEKQIKVDPATDQSLVKGFAQQLASDRRRDN